MINFHGNYNFIDWDWLIDQLTDQQAIDNQYELGSVLTPEQQRAYADYCGIANYSRCWVIRIDPGQIYTDSGAMGAGPRAHTHMAPCDPGHVWFADGFNFYNKFQGDTFKWSKADLPLRAGNCGRIPMWIMNIA
jgi:hypothetical protein